MTGDVPTQSELNYIRRLQRACDRWLLDPDNPSEYDLGPRASDVQVIFTAKGKRKKAKLSTLLRQVEDGITGIRVDRGETRTADLRMLILSASDLMHDQVRPIAELVGKLQTQGTGTVNLMTLAPLLVGAFDSIADPAARAVAKVPQAARLMGRPPVWRPF